MVAVVVMAILIGFVVARYMNTSQPILIVGALLGPGMFIISATTAVAYYHTVLWRGGDAAVVAKQIVEIEADLVLLQEAESAFVAELVAALGEDFPYVIEAESRSRCRR